MNRPMLYLMIKRRRESLDYLQNIYRCLQQLGLAEHVIIDLGLVNQAEYYTGIIFRGYFDEVGEPVLSGGRYDNLLSDFGAAQPAIGFAVHVDLASSVLEKRLPGSCRCVGDGSSR